MDVTRGTVVEQPDIDTYEQRVWERDPRYLLVKRILATPDFVRSPQLSKFLLYICTATFENDSQILSEHHIGVAVFGREPDYDSAADTIVRSHALRLRRRLEQYFQRDGRNEPIQLIVPRGGYAPIFMSAPERLAAGERSDTLVPDPEPVEAESAVLAPRILTAPIALDETRLFSEPDPHPVLRPAQFWRYRIAIALLSVLLTGMSVAFSMHLRTHIVTNRHHLLWGRLFTDDQPTHIVLGDSGLVLFHFATRQYVSLHDYLANDYSKQMPFVEHTDAKTADFLLHRRYTSMVDANALAHLLRLPEAIPERTLVHYSRDMHLNDFKSGNVIIIGAQEAVPWVELFETHMDFDFSIDNPEKHDTFVNRDPQPGELTLYSSYTPATVNKVYAVMAFLPNLSATGNVLILEGLSMAGTESAVDLTMDDNRLLPILEKIRRPDGSLPHFEMLLESDTLGESAGPARVVAIHLHD
jgi:hypothetical protein